MRPRLLPALLLTFLLSSPALSQDEDASEVSPVAWATLQVQPGRPTTFQLMGRTRDSAIATALQNIAGRLPQSRKYGEWTQWTVELPAPGRRGLLLHQDLDLAPLLEVLAA